MPNWKARRSRRARPECPASSPVPAPAASAAAAQKAATPRLRPPAHDTDPSGGARGGELSRLRDAPDWPGSSAPGKSSGGSGASHRACLHRQDLPSVSARRVPTAQLDGAVLGRQRLGVNLISRIATLREEGRLDPQHPVVSGTVHQLSLSVGAIVSAIPTGPRWLGWTASAPAQWSTPYRMGTMATCGLSAERYFLRRGRGKAVGSAGRVVLPLPTTITMAPSNGLGPPVAGHPRPGGALPQGHLAGPVGRGTPSALEARSFTHPQARRRHRSTGLGASCWPPLADPSASRASCAHIKELFVFVASRTCQRTTTPPSAACVIWSSAARLAAAPARSRAPRAR